MIEWLLVGALCVFGGFVSLAVIRKVVAEGVKDELAFPLGGCDTSMFDEIKGDCAAEVESAGASVCVGVLDVEEARH